MVATVQVEMMYGASPGSFKYKDTTAADKSGSRYMTSDQWDGSLTTYPIPIPQGANGISGSYWLTHCINCEGNTDIYL